MVADVALRAGLFSMPDPPPTVVASLFSAVVIMAIATTLLMPLGLKWSVSPRAHKSPLSAQASLRVMQSPCLSQVMEALV